MSSNWLHILIALVLLAGMPLVAQPIPLSEFDINTFATSHQRRPAVASDPQGNFVVVWTSYYQDGSSGSVHGQRVSGRALW